MRFLLCRLISPTFSSFSSFSSSKLVLHPRISHRVLTTSSYLTRQLSHTSFKMVTPNIESDEVYPKKHKVTVVGSGNWYVECL